MTAACRAETTFTTYKAPRNRAACGPKNREAADTLALDKRDQLLRTLKLPRATAQVQRRPDRVILLSGR